MIRERWVMYSGIRFEDGAMVIGCFGFGIDTATKDISAMCIPR